MCLLQGKLLKFLLELVQCYFLMISIVCSFHKVEVVKEGLLLVPWEGLGEPVGRHASRGYVLNGDCSSLDLLPQPVIVDIHVSELC
jgi:hypothetical protein